MVVVFFFFKQKTAYEMRISDWSSDVCSSDLYRFGDPQPGDVVVFKGPESWNDEYKSIRSDNSIVRAFQGLGSIVGLVPPDENDLVKRVVAVGGQTVQCLSEEEGLRVNGKPLTEQIGRAHVRTPGTNAHIV